MAKELNAINPYTHFVPSTSKNKNGQIITSNMLKRYYSQIDAEIYFGNEYVEDIVDFAFEIQQQSMPVFGYNSYTCDKVVQGSRIIAGTFTINFTSSQYLFNILKAAEEVVKTADNKLDNETQEQQKADGKKLTRFINMPLWENTFDIDIAYGNHDKNAVHIILTGVTLIGCESRISAYGSESSPILEAYKFYAKDINYYQ